MRIYCLGAGLGYKYKLVSITPRNLPLTNSHHLTPTQQIGLRVSLNVLMVRLYTGGSPWLSGMRMGYLTRRASHSRPSDYHMELWGNFRGSSLWKFPHNFPAEEFSMWIFPPLFLRESPGTFPHFPKILRCHKRPFQRVPVVKKYPSNVLMSILWSIERFTGSGKFPFHFNREFWEELRGWFCREISKRFSTAYNNDPCW